MAAERVVTRLELSAERVVTRLELSAELRL